ncbi:uncharacterized protein A1O9_10983 [Exophiala aquamarina CBS 119918]|uniref:Cyclin N-terminal domain-containing protein n=1 Tax=Exophiala aquamarina CBS 119918 TaxID=1182545 RepID=A0A072PBV9_9EURO|nr:uncharacterized protein A1O9_10983 [Exophiala aquamarina CBS 119918]KEF53075.1 hypothetical protein A1O9_10983 [Exophiala aquamarina CBS 119918]
MSVLHDPLYNLDWPRSNPNPAHENAITNGLKRWEQSRASYATGLPTPPASKAMPGVILENGYSGFSNQAIQHDGATHREGYGVNSQRGQASSSNSTSQYAVAPPPNDVNPYNPHAVDQSKINAIAPHLQIPESVNKSKGSLAEFAAEITCLFWFETAKTLQYAEDLPLDSVVDRGLLPDATPSIGFRKWVTTIISTTQVGKNVILLALMFIYRLKRFNPSVSGKRGSEFRLLTIALMLGNKFLDDNTYTNKTWAEVSGISVTEIHIMEVEFLSNMRYDLYASAKEWSQWKAKLGRFGAFYDKASKLPSVDENKSITAPVTPTSQSFSGKLPSPPSTHHSVSPFASQGSLSNNYPTLPHPLPASSQLPNSPLRQPMLPSFQPERKRSRDYSSDLPPAKRPHYSGSFSGPANGVPNATLHPPSNIRISPSTNSHLAEPSGFSVSFDAPRLDAPRVPSSLGLSTTHLAPLTVPSTRAMSSVYPITTSGYSQPVTPMSAIPQNLFQNPIPSIGEGARQPAHFPSAHTSPSNGYQTSTPTLPGLSPSYFLTHRASPYRPVRHVNTLLIPPPSTALQGPVRTVPSDQIHYQPLSKVSTQRRVGLLPLMPLDSWQHSNASTPIAQHHSFHY